MLEATLNWMQQVKDDNKPARRIMTQRGYKIFEVECKHNQISKLIKEGEKSQESYTEWSEKVKELMRKNETIVRDRINTSKDYRKLHKIEKDIKRKIRKTRTTEEERKILRTRRDLIRQHMEQENQKQHARKINKIVEEIKKSGGIDSEVFWKVKRKLENKPNEERTVVYNDKGEKIENSEEIKDVYANYYEQLLKTPEAETEEEEQTEQIVEDTMRQIITLGDIGKQEEVEEEEVNKIIKKLKRRKAKDSQEWKNEMIICGGEEMSKSIVKVFNNIQKEKKTPAEWEEMRIKSIHKKGSRHHVENRRGLFITNILSKLYERVLRERNMETTLENMSPYQCGGIKHRSITDHVFTIMAIIERNKYLGRNTYLTFADAVKCFDKLWLQDGLTELWKKGTPPADVAMVYQMNKKARAVVDCPAGKTKEIHLENVVRQGTVYGPLICAASTDRINTISEKIVTNYGPNLEIQALIFVDDIASAGDHICSMKTINACRRLETEKKFTFNLKKSGVLVVKTGNKKETIEPVIAQVKRGAFPSIQSYKYSGTTITEEGTFRGSIKEIKKKLPFKITTAKVFANSGKLGRYAGEAKLKMLETIILPSIMINIETWPSFSNKEIK